LSGDGLGSSAIMAETGKSKTCVWRWQERFMQDGCESAWKNDPLEDGSASNFDP
jgi:hypothetical protein